MTNPADQHSLTDVRRSADPPTLWLSLALGSVLIHLVLFILASLAATQTAKVQLDLKPIAVEFVDPNTVVERVEASNPTIADRPVTPSASIPSTTQAQPPALPQSSAFNPPPIEQPFVPQIRRNRVRPPIQPQPEPLTTPVPPPRNAPATPTPPQSNPPNQTLPSQEVPLPTTNPSQGAASGSTPNPSNNTALPPAASAQPVEGEKITQLPQGASVAVTVSNPRPPLVDVPVQLAQPIDLQKNILISYRSALAGQTIRLEATLVIDSNGLMLDVSKTTLRSSTSAIDPETLNDLATQIFRQWQFKPAQDNLDGKPLTPPQSNLIIDAELQLP